MVKPRFIPRVGVSIALRRDADRAFLLVKRGRPPAKDMWAFPGGKVEFGERAMDAAVRELKEETGIVVSPEALFFERPVEIIIDDAGQLVSHFVLLCFSAWVDDAEPHAGDDALEAAFVSIERMRTMDVTPSTLELAEWLRDTSSAGTSNNRD